MSSDPARERLVGRDGERAVVCRVLADTLDTGSASTLLVGGDAGIGKTALAGFATAQARASGFTVLEGTCLDIGAQLPFGPALDALRPLLEAGAGSERQPSLGFAGEVAAGLLRQDGSGPAMTAGQALGCLREVLGRCVTREPTLLVLEDMHWADQSTRDLALSLANTVGGPLVLLLTYRAEDLHRRHPFRATLTELSRVARAERIDLGPLETPALAELVTELTQAPVDQALVGAVLARSEGNPLFVEELLTADATARTLPTRLTGLLLARVDKLPDPSRRAVRAASVGGSRVDAGILQDVLGLSSDETESALREALDLNVLTQRAGQLEFRHALVREAVYEDLLPSERTRLHSAYGLAVQHRLDRQPEPPGMQQLGALAYHWYAAHDLPRALATATAAGRLMMRYGACPEARAHFDRALALWDQVPDAAGVAGVARVELLRQAAEAASLGGDADRGLALIDEATALVDADAEPLLASRVYATRGSFCAGFDDALGEQESVQQAVRLAEGTVSPELANALAVLADHLAGGQLRCVAAIETSQRAMDVARAVASGVGTHQRPDADGSRQALTQAQFAHGLARALVGEAEGGVAEVRSVITASRSAGQVADALSMAAALAWLLFILGRPGEAVVTAESSAVEARDAGLPSVELLCLEQVVEARTWLGELDEAALLLHDLAGRGLSPWRVAWYADDLAMRRGDPTAPDVARRTFDGWASQSDLVLAGLTGPTAVETLARTDPAGAVQRAARLLDDTSSCDADFMMAAVARAALRALVAAAESRVAPPDGLPEAAMRLLAATEAVAARGACAAGTLAGAELATAQAWAGRLAGEPSAHTWRRAHQAWADTGYRYPGLVTEVHLAEALLAAGERAEAREVITGAWTRGQQMGACGVSEELGRLAGRARVRLMAGRTRPAGPLDRLTPREREVLDLIAAGASNRGIADTLVISQKTASVHVSSLLAKLGVSSRLEAAALAHRLTHGS